MADLTPTHISWQPSLNAANHHTDRYANTELTVRRGQAFSITLYFNRPRQNGESLGFVTEIGPSPSESHRTRAAFNLSEALGSGWSAVQGPSDAGAMNFTISSPANAVIGRYNLSLLVTSGNKIFSRYLGQFVLLFNPWCPGDDVYMSNENERQEYVLNENGIIFVGNARYIEARGWYYGQFQDLLNICLTMLDLSLYYRQDPAMDVSRRGDPKYVGRVISSMINGNDNDNGVLLGKWQGSFHSHENPSRWDGSVVILKKWRQDNYRPVQYGQCWVFAGVMCTVLRCLGIPTRLVSNFNSAHDVDRNLSIDKYYDSSGRSLNISKDSTWDYHVWNESWFIRPDLGRPYNGWQVLDATPQEQSRGIFQCGPASVLAIKEGEVNLDYDTLFVYSEVNADCNRWIVYNDGTKKRVYCDTEIIGRSISTKAVGSNGRVDITANYKYPEGSSEERRVYKKALAKILGTSVTEGRTDSPGGGSSETMRNPGIAGKFKLAEPPVFGKDINLILVLNNLSSDRKSVRVDMSASTILYTRRTVTEILKAATSVELGPRQGKHIRVKIPYTHYGKYLTTDKRIQVTALCEVMRTHGLKLLVEKTIILEDTNIIIKLPRRVVVNKAVSLEISYANPLPEPVSRCVLLVTLMNQQVKINLGVPGTTEHGEGFAIVWQPATQALKIGKVNWQSKLNKAAHHTSDYSSTEVILRRGQPFSISLNLKTTAQSWDNFTFIASTGPSPAESQQTKAVFALSEEAASGWSAAQEPSEPRCLNFTILSPADAVIGRYKLQLHVLAGNKVSSKVLGQFVLLFNPWCPDDDVYMANEKERQEYVLNDSGIIFQGVEKDIQQEAWNYGQFEEDILDISLAILDRSLNHREDPAADVSQRNCPVYVSRVISAMVNSNDEKGVVEGKWSGKFRSGTNPLRWSGSVSILRKWYRARYRPVRYGQCWVFAGVTCTGIYQCGPASTKAIKEGDVNLDYDSPFVFAAVNADCVTWIRYSKKRKERIYSDTRKIGKFISTKAVGTNSRVDITANYKYPEGSLKERQVYKKALKLLGVRRPGKRTKIPRPRRRFSRAQPAQTPSISGKLLLDASPVIGQDILLTLTLRNLISDFKTIKVKLKASAILYTRKPKAEILQLHRSIKLGAEEVKEISFKISYSQYKNSLMDDRKILVTAVCQIKRGASLLVEKDIVLQDPFLTIKVLGPAVVHKPVSVEVTFTNPLSEEVTDCVLRAEGSGLLKEQLRIHVERMAPMETSTVEFEIIPYRSGTRQLQRNQANNFSRGQFLRQLEEEATAHQSKQKLNIFMVSGTSHGPRAGAKCSQGLRSSICMAECTKGHSNQKLVLMSEESEKQQEAAEADRFGSKGLSIQKCDFMIPENNKNHHTEEISTERLIVRRGQPFTITLNFSAPVHNYLQQMKRTFLIIQTGPHSSKADEIQVEFPISSLGDQKQWSAAVEEQDPNFWTLCVNTPANAPIGQYTLLSRASKSPQLLGYFTLLFNPWCRDDEVFLANEAQRQEYILNQDGIIYQGTENAILAQPWDFGQFEEDMVDICFILLALGEHFQREKDPAQRKNPVHVCRAIAAMLNCNEFRSLTEYEPRQHDNGTSPSKWLGSRPILQQWIASKLQPVRYGRCWVFAAVLCSVLRCLGIPTRVVTGFTWAHNTKGSLSVDEYYDEDGTLLTQDKSARLWTFHVWNECWMARTDLLPEYSGWQALDATCQEKSKGLSFCGPAPVHAIKEGDTQVDYDVCYFFAAVNAKCQVWIHKADDTLKPAFGGTKYTGNNISTKSVGSERCEDITQNYKYPEVNNLQVSVPYTWFGKELGENHLLRLTAVLRDEDSSYMYLAQEEISICESPLTIEFPENIVQYEPSTAKISLQNPLMEPLEQCVIAVAGRGLIYRQRNYRLGSVQAKSTQELQIPFTPTRAGPRRLTARLTCLQLQNLKSYRTTNIAAA
ncbi:hypothetical protein DUI87_27793 [Hirundo rustica rustica]|uniref:protein-glutamine gamma-glutamyltransferase n=1 Tax=Hirundo rustica rustica TaxID=333673 RepID=A0A3M0J2N3_HIRRU|nr:hypothetical protein DUI87_27793 [Hirundo rustica rustica]